MIARLEQFDLTERALLISVITSAALLAGAHLFERVGGLVPCILCLDQREAHWAALGVAAAGLFVSRVFRANIGAAAAVGAAALVYAVSAGLAFYHTGVEYGYWPGPAICSGAGSIGDLDLNTVIDALDQKADAPSCEDVQWRFMGVSMAGYNLLISAGLFVLTTLATIAETRRARAARTGEIAGGVS